jgi:diacylglycerol O-acyltransferase / wax synthase
VVKRANQQIGATVNDVLMASVSGAFSHYLLEHGGAAPSRFLVSMPVSVRALAKSTRCGNYFAPVPLELPAGTGGHGHRVLAVKERMDQLKGSPVPLVIYHLQRALVSFLPHNMSRFVIDFLANKCSAVVTNVRGPAKDLVIHGRHVRSLMFWVPQRARIGIGISILSFSGKVQVGVIADEALIPDPAELIQAFEDEFETLKVLASLEPDRSDLPPEDGRTPGIQRVPRKAPRPKKRPKPVRPPAEEKVQEPVAEGKVIPFQDGIEAEPVAEEAALV